MATLYLIPVVLSPEALHVIPAYVHEITRRIRVFVVEDERTARRYLRKTGFAVPFEEVTLLPINADTTPEEISHYMQYFSGDTEIGLMSEAGVPAVADPGSKIVAECHTRGVRVVPLCGPSSIIMALMASGMNGQQFTFHGYIPIKHPDRRNRLQQMDARARQGETQVCIETPYRNNHMLQDILANCHPATALCIAMDITGPKEYIRTQTIADWKRSVPDLEKMPAVFVLGRM